jgi:hypothetical protein
MRIRLPFPERIPMQYAVTFAAILYVVEQIQGTSPFYSICVFLFILVATFAFNTAGGFTRPSGGYIFFYATLGCIVGWTSKAVLNEPGDSNLRQPNLTAAVFLGGICAMAFGAVFTRKFARREPVLRDILTEQDASIAATGCCLLGLSILLLSNTVAHKSGDLLSALAQLGELLPLAIVLGVRHEIRVSGGRRSVNAVVLISALAIFVVNGFIGFSKEGFFSPIVSYLFAAFSMRFRISLTQVAAILVALYVIVTYLVPYSQYGRVFKSSEEDASVARFMENASVSANFLQDLPGLRRLYLQTDFIDRENGETTFFNQNEGLLDRLQMIAADDLLINATVEGKSQYGFTPLAADVLNVIPHALWPAKPTFSFGNLYAHEIGGLIDDKDLTTGVSFTPSGQAYHMGEWYGVLLVAPAIFALVFWSADSLCGDTRRSPWGLLFVIYYAHYAPETMLDGAIATITSLTPTITVVALVCSYVMPFLARIVWRSRQSSPAVVPKVRAA